MLRIFHLIASRLLVLHAYVSRDCWGWASIYVHRKSNANKCGVSVGWEQSQGDSQGVVRGSKGVNVPLDGLTLDGEGE